MSDRKQVAVANALETHRARRERLASETASVAAELRGLLARGSEAGLDVSRMARLAGISRDTAHRHLREAKKEEKRG